MAGQIVMEGFINFRMAPWLRRLVTRGIAIIPAAGVTIAYGESGTAKLLILSQVILSLQLPFAVIPLVTMTASKDKMGALVTPALAHRLRRRHRGGDRGAEREAAGGFRAGVRREKRLVIPGRSVSEGKGIHSAERMSGSPSRPAAAGDDTSDVMAGRVPAIPLLKSAAPA